MDICICFSSSSTTVFNASYSTLFMMKNLMMRNVHVSLFSENSHPSQVFHRSTFFQILLLTSQQGVKYPVSSFQAFFLNLFFFNSSTGWLGKGFETNLAMNICINLYDGDESYCNMIISLFFPRQLLASPGPVGPLSIPRPGSDGSRRQPLPVHQPACAQDLWVGIQPPSRQGGEPQPMLLPSPDMAMPDSNHFNTINI